MKPLNPLHVTVSIFVTMLVLFALTFAAGDEGLNLGFGKLKYPDTRKFLAYEQAEMAEEEVDSILSNIEIIDETDTSNFNSIRKDSTANGNLIGVSQAERILDEGSVRRLELPAGKENLLHPFFDELEQIQAKKSKMRILHYGDSQIEGDRMTAYIRQRLQSNFGGTGPGFIPVMPVYNQITARVVHSENWIRYAIFDPTQPVKIPKNAYGMWMSLTRFTPEKADSLVDSTATPVTAWVEVGSSNMTYQNARQFTHIDVHYGRCYFPVTVKVTNNGELIVQEKLKADGAYHVLPVRVGATPTALRIEFEGIHSPDFYGITLDGAYGLGVDNIAMRGSSGTTFAQLPFGLFNQMIDYVNTELVIMQFGGNSAVAVKSEQGAKNYASWFKSQINVVKSVRPEAQIIVIGPSDMSMKEGEDYVTYPYMEAVIEQMKRAAHEAGAAYWDLYSAMGGRNSMPVWVEKGLAGEDYIHFTNAGSKYTSEMFVKALLLEYQKYVDSKGGGGATAE
jgi:lysophospholipase L1-like esterase